jgi:hypothetical protein
MLKSQRVFELLKIWIPFMESEIPLPCSQNPSLVSVVRQIHKFYTSSPYFLKIQFVEFFNLPNPSSRAMTLGSAQPLTKTSTRNLPGDKKRPACRAGNLAAMCKPMSENVGASTSRNPKGSHGLYRYNFTFYQFNITFPCTSNPFKWFLPFTFT